MMQVEVTRCRQELPFVNGLFTEAKCTKSTEHLQHDTIKQKPSKVPK